MRNRPTNRIGRSWFPSTNKWGFPDLLPDMLGDRIPTELEVFRTGKFPPSKAAGKTVCFFIDDYRFESCYSYPQRMLNGLRNSQWYQVVEPDFSIWLDAPRVEQLMATYKTRWCGRYWQENGIKVIPILSWGEDSFDYCLDGIPHQPPLAAIETQCCNGTELETFHKGLYRSLDIVRPKTLLVYGQPKWLELPPGQKFKLYKTFMGRRRQSLKKKADHGR
jgi:hypothetical protein